MRTTMRLSTVALFGAFLLLSNTRAKASSADPGLMVQPTAAQSDPGANVAPVALSAAFDESLVSSPRVASVRAQLGIATAAKTQAKVLPNPSFFFLVDTGALSQQFGGSIPIEHPWKVVFRLIAAKSLIKQADLEIARNLWRFRGMVRRAYLDVVIANETKDTFVELQRLANELKKVADRRYQATDVAGLDVFRAELASMQASADLKQSERKVSQVKQRLSILLGRGYTGKVEVSVLPPFPLRAATHELLPDFNQALPEQSKLVDQALRERLDIKVAEQSIVVIDKNLTVARANRYPNPVLNAGSSYSGNPPRPSVATRGFYIGVTQEIPVLNRNQGEIARLQAQRAQLVLELNSIKNQATEEVTTAYQQIASARERVELFQAQILPASERVARLARRAYEVGQNDISSTLAAQQANVQTRVAYLDAVRMYQQALTDLEQSVGNPL